jgi:putative ABC transport system ATP-binding protein
MARNVERDGQFCLELEGVSKGYGRGADAVSALRDVSLALPRGSFTAVMGASGSGKSTFLHCAAGLERPDSGSVRWDGVEISRLGEPGLTQLRRERIGFVFQSFNLIASLNVRENITLPIKLAGRRPDKARLAEVAAGVGLADRLRHRPAQLSGGQQQRVAIARAILGRPAVILADEPTGALDSATGGDVLRLLRTAVVQFGQSVVMVTHDAAAACVADTVLFLADGRVAGRLVRPTHAQVVAFESRLRQVPA